MKVIVTNIQRFCLHDGPGIRTTVFFKGCNLRCPWCANPENVNFNIERYVKNGVEGYYGKEYTLEELYDILMKDANFYSENGGVTFSGGECLLFFSDIEPLLKKLKDKKINICIETALSVPTEMVKIALKYVDHFYIDVKVLTGKKVTEIKSNPELFVKNINLILKQKKDVIFRIPVVPGYTFDEKNLKKIESILENSDISKLELFKIHRLGEEKYKSLGLDMPSFGEISDAEMESLKLRFQKYVNQVDIIKLHI